MIIDETILVLAITDCRNHKLAKYPGVDCRCNLDFDKNITEPLKKTFSDIIRYDFLKRYLEVGVKATNQEILDIVREERPKYVLWPSMSYEIQERTFREIRKQGAIVIGWFFDDECRFDDYSKWWVPYLNYVLTCDRESVKRYEELGGRALFLLVYSNPEFFKRLDLPKKYDVSFVGTNIANRQELTDTLKNKGVLVRTFGGGWSSGYVSFDEMVKIHNQSKINLAFMQSYGENTRPAMKCKIFDICMCGGFLICEYIPGIKEFYKIDKEIVCFRDTEEAADKIKYYLSHESERERIAQAGWERAHREHTMAKRLHGVFEEIEKDVGTKAYRAQPSPEILEMPQQIRKLRSTYHLNWARALLLENYEDLWKDELDLSLAHNPSDRKARYLYAVGHFPPLVRPWLIRLWETWLVGRLIKGLRIFAVFCLQFLGSTLVRLHWLPLELRFRFRGYGPCFRISTHMTLPEKLLLYKLVRKLERGSVILEIGSYLGASSTFLAAGAKERACVVYCVDAWQNIGMSEDKRDTFNEFIRNTQRFRRVIIPLRGLCEEIANHFNSQVDLLFIDGDHSYEGVKKDVESWFPRLKNEAILIFHDIGWAQGVQRVVREWVRPLAKKEILLPNMYVAFISKRNGC